MVIFFPRFHYFFLRYEYFYGLYSHLQSCYLLFSLWESLHLLGVDRENFGMIQEPAGYSDLSCFSLPMENICKICWDRVCLVCTMNQTSLYFHSEEKMLLWCIKTIQPVRNNMLRHYGRVMFSSGSGMKYRVTTQRLWGKVS